MDWKTFARGILVVTEKNMRIYYFKGPVVVFGLLFPLLMFFTFFIGQELVDWTLVFVIFGHADIAETLHADFFSCFEHILKKAFRLAGAIWHVDCSDHFVFEWAKGCVFEDICNIYDFKRVA